MELKRNDDAITAYDKALTLKPDLANAWLGRGNVFADLKLYEEAIAAYDKAIALEPDLANAWFGRGNVFVGLKLYDEALDACNRALSLEPNLIGLKGWRRQIKMHICDWTSFDAECSNLISSVRDERARCATICISRYTFIF